MAAASFVTKLSVARETCVLNALRSRDAQFTHENFCTTVTATIRRIVIVAFLRRVEIFLLTYLLTVNFGVAHVIISLAFQ